MGHLGHGENGEVKLAEAIEKYFEASTPKAQTAILRRFNKTMRVSLIEHAKMVVKNLYTLHNEGVSTNGRRTEPKFEGLQKKHLWREVDRLSLVKVEGYV